MRAQYKRMTNSEQSDLRRKGCIDQVFTFHECKKYILKKKEKRMYSGHTLILMEPSDWKEKKICKNKCLSLGIWLKIHVARTVRSICYPS